MTGQQLLLDIRPAAAPSLENFVVGKNAELLAHLSALSEAQSVGQIYLWGPPRSGRSHLLHGVRARARARPVLWIETAISGDWPAPAPGSLLIVDDVDRLGEAAQIALFHSFNAARLAGLALLLAGARPPRELALREDLRTRIAATLVYEVQPLSDQEKAAALARHAEDRGMRIDETLIIYLLHHSRRDLPSLLAVLDSLDLASLRQHRPPTLPLLREVLQELPELDN